MRDGRSLPLSLIAAFSLLCLAWLGLLPRAASGAISIDELQQMATAYEQRLTQRAAGMTPDLNALVQQSVAQRQAGDMKGLIATLEAIAGAAPQQQSVWLTLAMSWEAFEPTADDAVAAAYAAYVKAVDEQQRIDALNTLSMILRKRMQAIEYSREPQEIAQFSKAMNWSWHVYDELFTLLRRDAEKRDFLLNTENLPTFAAFTIVSNGVQWQSGDKAIAGCFEFSLPLAGDPSTYRPFLSVGTVDSEAEDAPVSEIPFEITVSGKSLCMHGLEHGVRYAFTFREGLPSEIGAPLPVTKRRVEVAPDLPPTVYFRSAAYIVPRGGSKVVPVYTVNVDTLNLNLMRISDRSIHRQVALKQIGNTLDYLEFEQMRSDFSESIWSGEKAIAGPRNTVVATNLPLFELLEERKVWVGQEPIEGAEIETPPVVSDGSQPGSAAGAFASGTFYRDPASSQVAGSPPWEPGVYALTATRPGDSESLSSVPLQWFIFTDIGLTYYRSAERIYVVARSLASGAALEGVRIQLIAANNRVLDEGTTQEHGVADFEGRLADGRDGNRLVAILAYHDAGDDFSYVDFQRDGYDLSRHGIAGREPPKLFDAYVYTDRGLYRPTPEEPISVTIALRDAEGRQPTIRTPLRLVLTSANGQTLIERTIAPERIAANAGVIGETLRLQETAPLGAATLEVYLGQLEQPIGATTIQISHFRPDRARITLVDRDNWQSRLENWTLKLAGSFRAQYLYGIKASAEAAEDAPASNLASELEVKIERASSPFEGCYKTFAFGNADESFPSYLSRKSLGSTGTDGTLSFALDVPSIPPTSLPLSANVKLTVLDEAGTVASRFASLPIARPGVMIGLRRSVQPVTAGRYDVGFDVIALNGREPAAAGTTLSYRILREQTGFLWFKSYQGADGWDYKPNVIQSTVAEGTLEVGAIDVVDCEEANGAVPKAELTVGDYVLEVTDGSGAKALTRFTLGASSATDARPEPDRLIVRASGGSAGDPADVQSGELDYQPGEEAQFGIETPFEGRVLLAIVEAGRIEAWFEADTTDRRASFTVPIPQVWSGQAFYAMATVFRRDADGTEAKGPSRAIGFLHFSVERAQRKLKLSLEGTPYKITPSAGLQVRLTASRLSGERYSGRAFLAVYAVDEGLVNMTEHGLPDPFGHFFGQRRLALSVADSYGRLLLTGGPGEDQGGDANILVPRILSNNYLSEAIVSYYLPPTEIEFREGIAYRNDTPFINLDASFRDFSGTVRLAAIVWTADAFGVESRDVVVRSTVVARLGLPRFVAPGDKPLIPLTLENLEATGGPFKIEVDSFALAGLTVPGDPDVDTSDPSSFTMTLAPKERKIAYLELDIPDSARGEQRMPFRVHITGTDDANPVEIEQSRTVMVRRPTPPETLLVASRQLQPGKSLKLDDSLLPKSLKTRYASYEVQARLTSSPLLLAAAQPADELATGAKTVERLVSAGILALQQSPDGKPTAEALAIANDLVALQNADGSFVPLADRRPRDAAEARSAQLLVPVYGADELWRGALALDYLRLVNGTDGQFRSAMALGRDYLQSQLRGRISGWEQADPTQRSAQRVNEAFISKPEFWSDVPGMQAPQGEGYNYTPEPGLACQGSGVAYATFVLTKLDAIGDDDLRKVGRMCADAPSPLVQVIMAASLRSFGRNDEDVNVVLASFDTLYAGGAGEAEAEGTSSRQEEAAMMLAFLVQAKADEAQVKKVLTSMQEALKNDLPLPLSTQAWLARAAIEESARGEVATVEVAVEPQQSDGVDVIASRSAQSVATRFLSAKAYADAKMTVRNTGAGAVTVHVFVRGVPKKSADAGAGEAGLEVRQRLFDLNGREITGEPALAQNDLVYVVIEGNEGALPEDAATEASESGEAPADEAYADPAAERILVIGYLPTGLEIVKPDLYREIQIPGAGPPKGLPAAAGVLGHLEARDDKLIALVTPQPKGEARLFRIGYLARATTAGEIAIPPVQVQIYERPEVAAVSEAGAVLKVEQRQ